MDLPAFVEHVIPETWLPQVEHLVNILFHIERTLAQNICLDPSLPTQHVREHACRRSELCRVDGNVWGALWQKADSVGRFDRQHGRHRSNKSSSSSDSTGDLTLMLARLCLRQEDMLNAMSMDRSFIIFLQCGKGNIMPLMLQTS